MIEFAINVLEQGFIFSIVALGVYITYKILDFPDLSVDGTIVLGGAVTASLIIRGFNPLLATLIAILSGAIAGATTGIIHVHLKITNLLSGILVMIGLYTINLRIMASPNISLADAKTVFSMFNNKLIVIVLVVLLIKVLLDLYLKTKSGMLLKTTGCNPHLVTTLGVNLGNVKILGLMLANALVALSGSLLVQYQNFSDINSGTGTIVFGLASVIIGYTLFKNINIKWLKTTSIVILGAIIYKSLSGLALQFGLPASDFKLITALIVIAALGINNKKFNVKSSLSRLNFSKKGEVKC